ncbi:MAG TPA: pyridoxal-dependent decarboxylase [Gemmatimonadaceae bacterium]|nr:pyridoxal-dependent decarboxylase [Gemmatimonadaceae bacterium]
MTTSIFDALEQDMGRDAALPFVELVASYLAGTRDGAGPVSSARSPGELAERFHEPLPLQGQPLRDVAERVERDILSDINRLTHPMYMGHQVSPPLPAAIWMESLTGAMNQSVAVSEMSPTGTAVEAQLIQWMTALAGFAAGSGGTLTSGGTEATFTALLAARAAAMPHAWEDGVGSDAPVVLCGEHAHYAVTRAVAQLGLGLRRAIRIPSCDGHMDVSALVARLDELHHAGTRVMAVVATAGSTATGSFDDLDAIGAVCESRGIWFHVDGAHGASALLSSRHRHRMRGVERARSLAWDPHKMMLMPIATGMLLVRDERDLERAFVQHAPYLFHADGGARTVDQGVRSFLCSRRVDAFKVWVALQRYGAQGMAELYDYLCALADTLYEEIATRGDFEAMHEPESNILCFRWVGDGARDDAELDAFNRELRERYNRSGRGWITTTVLARPDGDRRVLRVTLMNPRTKPEHLRAMLDGISALAEGSAA